MEILFPLQGIKTALTHHPTGAPTVPAAGDPAAGSSKIQEPRSYGFQGFQIFAAESHSPRKKKHI